jgi:hypothetical protein
MVSGRYRYQVCNDFRTVADCNFQIDAARIVQCVNEYDELTETIATLRSEKAELIEALESILQCNEREDLDLTQTVDLMIGIATQTLAKIETK